MSDRIKRIVCAYYEKEKLDGQRGKMRELFLRKMDEFVARADREPEFEEKAIALFDNYLEYRAKYGDDNCTELILAVMASTLLDTPGADIDMITQTWLPYFEKTKKK